MQAPAKARRVATLWNLTWKDDSLSCVVDRTDGGFRLSIQSSDTVIVSERFDLEPRVLARASALRDSLKRRGWSDVISDL